MARTLWLALAVLGIVYWVLVIPTYYRHALALDTTDCCVVRDPAAWRVGLDQLGLSPSAYAAYRVIVNSLAAWSMLLIGFLIFLRKSDEWIALFVSITLLGLGMTSTNEGALGPEYPQWITSVVNAYADLPYLAFFLIPLIFPDGRFVPRWTVVAAPILAFEAMPDTTLPGSLLSLSTWPEPLASGFAIALFGTVLVAPIYRYRHVSGAIQRKQTKWAVFGLVSATIAFLVVGTAIPALFPGVVGTPSRAVLYDMVSVAIVAGAFAGIPVAFGVAILRFHLWDIDLIVNRAAVYAALTATVVGLYALVVVGFGALFQTQGNILLSLCATALVAVLFQPMRDRLQLGVNRLMYGERDEPYVVISRLGRQLEGTLTPDAVLPVLVDTVSKALKLPYAAVAMATDEGLVTAAATGTRGNDAITLPLFYQGDTVGQLILGLRSGEVAFSSADLRLLGDLARQAGVAVYAVRLTADLQRSRQWLVTAQEEERRRLRRDLHDGLGPALATMAMQSEEARDLLKSQPAETDRLLADLATQLQQAIADIRRLVHDLRPPALDDLGLIGALRTQLARFERGGLRITLDTPDSLPTLPAAVEVAVYRITLESLTNVVHHAEAGACRVRLSVDEAASLVQLEVSDDGRGITSGRVAGAGLASMRERAAELGGLCVIDAGEMGGTRVRATLPVTLDGNTSPGPTLVVEP